MASEVVEVRVVAASPEAARAAVERLRAASVEELGEPKQGRKGEWLAYGVLAVEVEQAAATAPLRRPPRRRR